MNTISRPLLAGLAVLALAGCQSGSTSSPVPEANAAPAVAALPAMPTVHEKAAMTFAPNVPPAITRTEPRIVDVELTAERKVAPVAPNATYEFWTFNGQTPGPFVRARVGDTLHVTIKNADMKGMPHSVDFHAVTGPGGGMMADMASPDEPGEAWFRLLQPGLYLWHCGTPPVMDHLANGMYGLILVEPQGGLPKVDHEYYVLQSEIYADAPKTGTQWTYSHAKGLDEKPTWVVFNGAVGSMIGGPAQLQAKTGETVRLYVGNAGPNLVSSFHMMGTIFSSVYRDGDLIDAPAHGIQTTMIPAGGAAIVELKPVAPGDYTFVDHSIFRVEKGAAGTMTVSGPKRPDIIMGMDDDKNCTSCLAHPGNT